jgi:hypothetical protein
VDEQHERLQLGIYETIELSANGQYYRWSDSGHMVWYGPAENLSGLGNLGPEADYFSICDAVPSFLENGHDWERAKEAEYLSDQED